jgi:hypothetical protein
MHIETYFRVSLFSLAKWVLSYSLKSYMTSRRLIGNREDSHPTAAITGSSNSHLARAT